MGWITNPAPGSEFGPCAEDCKHVDCAAGRKGAAELCEHCQKPIGYDTKFYCDGIPNDQGTIYSHAVCAWAAAAERRKSA